MTASSVPPDIAISSKRPHQHSSLTVCLWVTTVLSIIISIILAIFIIVIIMEKKFEKNVCFSKACTLTASTLIEAMDPAADPCTDFYEFSCGGYMRNNPAISDTAATDVFEQHKVKILYQLKDMIERMDVSNQIEPLKKAHKAYFTCMNGSFNGEKESNTFKNFVTKTLGEWPLASGKDWKLKDPSLELFFGRMLRLGYSIQIVNVKIGTDMKDPSIKRIIIEEPSGDITASKVFRRRKRELSMDEDGLHNLPARFAFIRGVSSLLGNDDSKFISDELSDMIRFEYFLDEISTEANDTKNYTELYHKMTLEELNKITQGKLDWVKMLNTMFNHSPVFKSSDEVIVTDVQYLKKVVGALNYPQRSIVNFIIWKILFELAEHAGPQIEQMYYTYQRTVHSLPIEPLKWAICLTWINDVFSFALSRLFVHEYINPAAKESAIPEIGIVRNWQEQGLMSKLSLHSLVRLIGNLDNQELDYQHSTAEEYVHLVQEAYKRNIQNSEWLDETTKQLAVKKVDAMKRFVGYPEIMDNDEKLTEIYHFVPKLYDDHFQNVITITRRAVEEFLLEYQKPVNTYSWTENPTDVNAFYEAQTNSVWFPAGVLNLPFFDKERLAAVNFGIIGSLVGHEVGHAFDNEGSQFDETGRLRQWWSTDTLKKFIDKTKCYIKQYDEFCPTELEKKILLNSDNDTITCVDGTNTLAENLADNIGVQCAYDAYKIWVSKNGKEKRLPGLEEYTPQQIFFISFAYMWCENVPSESWDALYGFDTHAAGKFRVLGSLANMKEFSTAFQCAKGKMNREDERCTLW